MSDHGSNGLAAPGTVAYSEPHFPALATLIAVLYLAQVARNIAGKLLYAGLLGEIAIGVIFGPVAKLLPVRAKPNPQGPGITAIDGRRLILSLYACRTIGKPLSWSSVTLG